MGQGDSSDVEGRFLRSQLLVKVGENLVLMAQLLMRIDVLLDLHISKFG